MVMKNDGVALRIVPKQLELREETAQDTNRRGQMSLQMQPYWILRTNKASATKKQNATKSMALFIDFNTILPMLHFALRGRAAPMVARLWGSSPQTAQRRNLQETLSE